jgi:hypothetical protein
MERRHTIQRKRDMKNEMDTMMDKEGKLIEKSILLG